LVAFIDVLGFKNLVYGATTGPIDTYYTFLLSNFKTAVAKRNFDFLLISDSIVIYCNDDIESLSELVKMINMLQAGLLGRKILIRGAISHGGLFVDKPNNIIVGSGLINAYHLESQARFPRIIFDRSLIRKYYASTDTALAKNIGGGWLPHLSIRAMNGHQVDFPYLNYGRIFAGYLSNQPFEGVLALFTENYYRNDHTEKFQWLKSYLIACLEDQHTHLAALHSPNSNDRKRLKHGEKYIPLFRAL
jgi:hypothetical protein